MSNPNFVPEWSTNQVYVDTDTTACLTDHLGEMEADIAGKAESTHTHSEYSISSHTHSEYAPTSHTHSEYSPTSHTHTGFAAESHEHTNYASSTHNHDEAYSTADHTHNSTDITNPPMLAGVEYLTNERWNGEPLYTVLLDCGTFADGTIFDSNINCRYVVRYCGRIGWSAVPLFHYTIENAFTSWVEVSNHNGHIRIIMQGGASVGSVPVQIQVWYTKQTQ